MNNIFGNVRTFYYVDKGSRAQKGIFLTITMLSTFL